MKLKDGVDVRFLGDRIQCRLWNMEQIFQYHLGWDWELTITSASDGKHSEGSKHYSHEAVDLRTKWLNPGQGWQQLGSGIRLYLVRDLRKLLGADFDVVDEKTHIHIEFDPK